MQDIEHETIRSVVAANYKTALVFRKFNIDFQCSGNLTIAEACRHKQVPSKTVLLELDQIMQQPVRPAVDFNSWPLTALVDYIERVLHRYVGEKIFQLQLWIDACCKLNDARFPNMKEVKDIFQLTSGELLVHLAMEEQLMFPSIRKLASGEKLESKQQHRLLEAMRLELLMQEHQSISDSLKRISRLLNQYYVPEDAAPAYHLAAANLREFEEDLLFHMHLENNILARKVRDLLG